MPKLLILADDITGALDTAVMFAGQGVSCFVTSDLSVDFNDAEVLAVNTETRHLSADEAYRRVYSAARNAVEHGVRYIYKKTDSALRGNIGAELAAALDAAKTSCLTFVPAYPQINRVTCDGQQYIDGVPLHKSSYAQDPLEPMLNSSVAEIVSAGTDKPVRQLSAGSCPSGRESDEPAIYVCDAITVTDLEATGRGLAEGDLLHVTAGCAGFAGVLSSLIDLDKSGAAEPFRFDRILFVAGSVNRATIAQANFARKAGIPGTVLSFDRRFDSDFLHSPEGKIFVRAAAHELFRGGIFVLQSLDDAGLLAETDIYLKKYNISPSDMHKRISENVAAIVTSITDIVPIDAAAVFGGDTLLALTECLGGTGLIPRGEILPGVVVSDLAGSERPLAIISKSGGFGGEDVIMRIMEGVGGLR